MEFNAEFGIHESLSQAHAAKAKLQLHLRSGQSFGGYVGSLGQHTVLLTQLTGREFFDALIRVDEIAVIEARR